MERTRGIRSRFDGETGTRCGPRGTRAKVGRRDLIPVGKKTGLRKEPRVPDSYLGPRRRTEGFGGTREDVDEELDNGVWTLVGVGRKVPHTRKVERRSRRKGPYRRGRDGSTSRTLRGGIGGVSRVEGPTEGRTDTRRYGETHRPSYTLSRRDRRRRGLRVMKSTAHVPDHLCQQGDIGTL